MRVPPAAAVTTDHASTKLLIKARAILDRNFVQHYCPLVRRDEGDRRAIVCGDIKGWKYIRANEQSYCAFIFGCMRQLCRNKNTHIPDEHANKTYDSRVGEIQY